MGPSFFLTCANCGGAVDRPTYVPVRLRYAPGESRTMIFTSRAIACRPCAYRMVGEAFDEEFMERAVREWEPPPEKEEERAKDTRA